jgi:hypothetical protein
LRPHPNPPPRAGEGVLGSVLNLFEVGVDDVALIGFA